MAAAIAPTAALDRDAEVGAALYEEHAEAILRYCRRQLGSESEAEDALQTTFVYALRAIRRGVVPENDAAWLTTIAKNVCHWQRRTAARRGWHAGEVDFDAIESGRPEPGAYEDLRGLDEALASIPEQQRRAIVLREWLGVGPAEIAGKLGLSPTATHALLTRARISLAGALTVARQPAVMLAWLVYELRSQLRNLVGAASTKAGVAAITVAATTGVGGLAVQHRATADAEPRAVATRPVRAAQIPGVPSVGTETPRNAGKGARHSRVTVTSNVTARATNRPQVASSELEPPVAALTQSPRGVLPATGSGSPGNGPASNPPTTPTRPADTPPSPPLAKLSEPALPIPPAPTLPTVDPSVTLPELPPVPPTDEVTRIVPGVVGAAAEVVSETADPPIPAPPPAFP